jgi:hypothetical protein
MTFIAVIIMNFRAIPLEFGLFAPSIFETMKMDLYSQTGQCLQLIKNFYDSAVISRIGNIERNYMYMLFQANCLIDYKKREVFFLPPPNSGNLLL